MARVGDYEPLGTTKPANLDSPYDEKLEIFIKCSDLIQIDTFSKSDPFCVLFIKRLGKWMEFGRTESITNNLNPRFVQSIYLDLGSSGEDLDLKFTVYDLSNFSNKDLRKNDIIGSCEVQLKTLLTSQSPYCSTLKIHGDSKSRGSICLYAKKTKECRSKLRLQIKGSKLSKKGVFGKCNAYVEICRPICNGIFHPVYRSEVIVRSQEPRWPVTEISLQKLCDNNTDIDIIFQCYNFIQDGADDLIGETRCTIKSLLEKNYKTLNLTTPQQRNSKRQKSSGCLKILQCNIERQYNVLDFVRGGCNMKFLSAIDFTLSNGDPRDLYSTHSIISEHNEYLEALRSLGAVLSYYCTDKEFPVFGFGAKLSAKNQVCHHFALNGDESSPGINGLENIIERYLDQVQTLIFSGPTYLTPILQRILQHHVPKCTQDSQQYVTVLILIDGFVNDLDAFMNEVKTMKQLPMSIVIVGIGPADFQTMEEFFRKKKEKKKLNIHFITARSQHTKHISKSKVRDISFQVCRDIVSYMNSNNIHPNAVTQIIKPLYESLELDGTLERRTLAQSLSQINILNNSNCCPSCGSTITNLFQVT